MEERAEGEKRVGGGREELDEEKGGQKVERADGGLL